VTRSRNLNVSCCRCCSSPYLSCGDSFLSLSLLLFCALFVVVAWGEINTDSDEMDGTRNSKHTQSLWAHLTPVVEFTNSLLMYLKRERTPAENMLMELGNVRKTVLRESSYFNNPLVSDELKRKRLNFLFVKDLLDGVNGMILDHKDRLDNEMVGQVPLWHKVVASVFLCVSNVGMLYYVYLFAMNQSSSRQQGWFNSFQVWLFFEIFIISTGLVLVEHVLIPLWSLREVQRVKERIVSDILIFQKKLKHRREQERSQRKSVMLGGASSCVSVSQKFSSIPEDQDEDEEQGGVRGATGGRAEGGVGQAMVRYDPRSFNAAEFLYASHRMAQLFPQYPESELILQYKTLWPKKSFKHGEKSVKKKYDKRFEFITKTFARVGIFAVTSVIQLPPALQDMGIQMILITAVGYVVRLHLRLFEINPVLVLFPSLLFGLVVYLFVVSGKRIRAVYQTHPLKDEDEDQDVDEKDKGGGEDEKGGDEDNSVGKKKNQSIPIDVDSRRGARVGVSEQSEAEGEGKVEIEVEEMQDVGELSDGSEFVRSSFSPAAKSKLKSRQHQAYEDALLARDLVDGERERERFVDGVGESEVRVGTRAAGAGAASRPGARGRSGVDLEEFRPLHEAALSSLGQSNDSKADEDNVSLPSASSSENEDGDGTSDDDDGSASVGWAGLDESLSQMLREKGAFDVSSSSGGELVWEDSSGSEESHSSSGGSVGGSLFSMGSSMCSAGSDRSDPEEEEGQGGASLDEDSDCICSSSQGGEDAGSASDVDIVIRIVHRKSSLQ
jgi:hypothetical protein